MPLTPIQREIIARLAEIIPHGYMIRTTAKIHEWPWCKWENGNFIFKTKFDSIELYLWKVIGGRKVKDISALTLASLINKGLVQVKEINRTIKGYVIYFELSVAGRQEAEKLS